MGTSGISRIAKMVLGNEVVQAGDPKEELEEDEEEELEDLQDTIKEECRQSPGCLNVTKMLEVCSNRVESTQTEETCEEELFDFVHCVDSCVAQTLFSKLK